MIRLKLDEKVRKDLAQIETRGRTWKFHADLTRRWNKTGLRAGGRTSKNYLSGQRKRRRTGALAQSIIGRGEMVNGVPAMRLGVFRGPALRYAGVQEYGTRKHNPRSPYDTIKSKRAGGALAMPVGDSLTGAGVSRYGGPREDPRQLRFLPALRGRLVGILVEEGGVEAQYLLLRSVEIRPGFFLRDGMEQAMPDLMRDVADTAEFVLMGRSTR